MSPRPVAPGDAFLGGIWRENPVLVQALGLCPILAVTNTVANGIAMGLAVAFVLTASSFMVSLVKRLIPNAVRISAYIMIIATFVSVADMTLQAVAPAIHKSMGPFVPLIVVNCIILGRAEAFASRQGVLASVADATGNSIGFALILMVMSGLREVIGSGTFLGFSVFGPHYEPWVIMILPPGGFFTLGLVLLLVNARQRRRSAAHASAESARRAA
jgi:electron transport complex protein RnfE